MHKAMSHPFAFTRRYVRSPNFSRFWRYSCVSGVSTAISLGGLFVFYREIRIGTAAESNLLATAIASVPAYYLNRTWAWGRSGRSRVMREVVPFWSITVVGVLLSTGAVHLAATEAPHFTDKRGVTVLVELANFATYAVLWFGKFTLFNRYLFKSREAPAEGASGEPSREQVPAAAIAVPALDGQGARQGLPAVPASPGEDLSSDLA